MGVDILPSELPREASAFFGDRLAPIVRALAAPPPAGPPALAGAGAAAEDAAGSAGRPLAELPPHIAGACITDGGRLTLPFAYIRCAARYARARRMVRGRRSAAFLVGMPQVVA